MSSDLSLEGGIEKFSFIYTLTIYRPKNSNGTSNYGKQNRQDMTPLSQSPSSALSATKKDSSLSVNSPVTISSDWYHLDCSDTYDVDLPISEAVRELPSEDYSSSAKIAQHWSKLFFVAGITYLLFVIWWLFIYKTGHSIIPWLSASETTTISKTDAEFLDYMARSLDIIDRQVIAQEKSSAKTTSVNNSTPTIVYVPVYTSPPNNPQPTPQEILPPPPPPQLTAINPPLTTPSKIPLPPPPTESTTVETPPLSPPSNTVTEKVAKATVAPKIDSTLVGLIELGEGSAALFKINGITQRIWLGETIENTGWILESVTSQTAKISRDGKSRTLTVGESF